MKAKVYVDSKISGLMVQIKHILIAKCDLCFQYHDAKEISFYIFCDAKLGPKYE